MTGVGTLIPVSGDQRTTLWVLGIDLRLQGLCDKCWLAPGFN